MDQQRFKKSIAVSNTVSHRLKKKKSLKRNNVSLSSSAKYLFDYKKGKYVINEEVFDIDKVLSKPGNSASSSVVYLLKTKNPLDNNRYICKVSLCKHAYKCYNKENYPLTEIKMYKLMNILVDNYITPHVFKIMGNVKQIKKSDLSSNVSHELNQYQSNFLNLTAMINETSSNGGKIRSLNDFVRYLYTILPITCDDYTKTRLLENIFFQIVYTLETFNIIGIKHNDIHFGNIFIIENERNIINNNLKDDDDYYAVYNREYTFKGLDDNEYKKIKLKNLGFDVRIYDFDRS